MRKRKINKKKRINFMLKSGGLLIVLCFVVYVIQINAVIKENYLIKDYKLRVKELYEDNENLEKRWYNFSLEQVEEIAKKMDFEKVKKISYIKIKPVQIAGR